MFDVDQYLGTLLAECIAGFGGRLLYMGLQGSYMRGEATPESDVDVMTVLDRLTVEDMDEYKTILDRAGQGVRSCGFICGKDELSRWNPLEICQLRHTTKDLYGTLADLLPEASRTDEVNYVKLSLGNLYHELCHRYIHGGMDESVRLFRGTCKGLFFILQNLYYLETGRFVIKKSELKELVTPEDREVLNASELPDGYDFDAAFWTVFEWCREAFDRVDRAGYADPADSSGVNAPDVSYVIGNSRFNYRVCAVFVSDNKLLAMRDGFSPYYYLPGGRVKLGETAENAMIREIEEELNFTPRIIRPLWLNQGFFTEDVSGMRYHEICVYFLVDASDPALAGKGEAFELHEKNRTNRFEWLAFDRLKDEYFYPTFLKTAIYSLPETFTIMEETE